MPEAVEQDAVTTEDFAAMLAEYDSSQKVVEENELATGTVLAVTKDHVLVDIGGKSEGLININEFRSADGITIDVGDKVTVLLEALENEHGLCVLSKEKADRLQVWEQISAAAERDELITGTIVSRVKGGLSVDIGVKAFLPGSQVELRPTRNLDKYLGQTFEFKVIKFNKRRGNIVLSRRVLLEKEREHLRQDTLNRIEAGQIIDGIVKNITEYGAFIDLGGIDGLLHVTDMSWGRVNHPSEVLNIGEELKVQVLKFDPKRERVSLGLKQLTPDPWSNASYRYPPLSRQLGRVVSLIDYGAFVELEQGIEGLIHISEMSWTKRVKHPSKMVGHDDIIEVVVLGVDEESKKISLGMKQMTANPWTLLEERYPAGTRIRGNVRNITDFGVFIGIEEGIDGLVHVSDISWTTKIKHPAEVFTRGAEVEAVVLNIDVENERFSLGIKQLSPDPWELIPEAFPPGRITDATVTKLTDFGAFAQIAEGVEGLIHISQLSLDRVENPGDVVTVGESYKVEVISVDPRERKIALSIKSFIERSEHGHLREYRDEPGKATASLGDVFGAKIDIPTGEHPAVDEPSEEAPAEEAPAEEAPAEEEKAEETKE
jgi:small subunit ribosomal protein S1